MITIDIAFFKTDIGFRVRNIGFITSDIEFSPSDAAFSQGTIGFFLTDISFSPTHLQFFRGDGVFLRDDYAFIQAYCSGWMATSQYSGTLKALAGRLCLKNLKEYREKLGEVKGFLFEYYKHICHTFV